MRRFLPAMFLAALAVTCLASQASALGRRGGRCGGGGCGSGRNVSFAPGCAGGGCGQGSGTFAPQFAPGGTAFAPQFSPQFAPQFATQGNPSFSRPVAQAGTFDDGLGSPEPAMRAYRGATNLPAPTGQEVYAWDATLGAYRQVGWLENGTLRPLTATPAATPKAPRTAPDAADRPEPEAKPAKPARPSSRNLPPGIDPMD